MHEEILSAEQKNLLPLLAKFSDKFGLIGGTAVALQLGHRRSIDFDLLTVADLKTEDIRNKLGNNHHLEAVLVDETHEFTVVIDAVKLTFLKFPFPVVSNIDFHKTIKMPDLLSLGAMKAYALGRRAKWKDYVDLYYIIHTHSFGELITRANDIFGPEFNEKLFREQLAYFKDIDYTEKVDYMPSFQLADDLVKSKLTEISLQKY